MTTPTAVAVVVPARNEEALLPACLDAIDVAVEGLRAEHPHVEARVFVALDACRDGSAAVVAGRSGVTAVELYAGCVGIARAAAVDAASEWAAGSSHGSLWLANTDADSVVPPHWLTTQVRLATAGFDLVVGTVRPLPADLSPDALAAWHERHSTADGHEHVHGANLGFTTAAYATVGGYAPLRAHEDVEIVAAMKEAGLGWIATGAIPVTTSGRAVSRVTDGFATYLEGLAT
ncbi:glycosyltransferase [Nocardioides oleivorans]|uniref:4,4'-diaponeurosporenoate glycosyltransferase n=1 Tax=Nocardioides oleivorans TaxID=273676 RepID=A0A4Q2RSN7_9ACTN|nr:glycosyltransferase [Nocardioides oleivorans]RYB92061.1 glycosyltransferase [Nocardioides oleivorans]